MLTHFSYQIQSITDLAASLTDQALEDLGGVAVRGDSVEMELKLWRALTAELKREPDFAQRPDARLDGDLKQVVHRAAQRATSPCCRA